jgi:hypothetical protein
MHQCRKAASLVELLLALGLIGLLVSLALPAILRAHQAAARTGCLNNLRQLGFALHDHHAVHGRLPPVSGSDYPENPQVYLSWTTLILPQLGEESLYRASEQACLEDPDPRHNPPHGGFATPIRTLVCPTDPRLLLPLTDAMGVTGAFTSYIGNGGALPPGASKGLAGIFHQSPGIRLTDVTDGTGVTYMVGERPPPYSLQAGWWYPGLLGTQEGFRGPNTVLILGGPMPFTGDDGCAAGRGTFGPGRLDNPCDRYHLWSLHPGGASFLFADASARFLAYAAEPLMYALASRSGEEAVELP